MAQEILVDGERFVVMSWIGGMNRHHFIAGFSISCQLRSRFTCGWNDLTSSWEPFSLRIQEALVLRSGPSWSKRQIEMSLC